MKYVKTEYLDSGPVVTEEIDFTYTEGKLSTRIVAYYDHDGDLTYSYKYEYTFENDRISSVKIYDKLPYSWSERYGQSFFYDEDGYLIKCNYQDQYHTRVYVYEEGIGNAAVITSDPLDIRDPYPEIK